MYRYKYGNNKSNEKIYYFNGQEDIKEVVIPNEFTNISDSAFKCCSLLSNVYIPNSIIKIRCFAFYGCKSITSINIPKSVVYIGSFTF